MIPLLVLVALASPAAYVVFVAPWFTTRVVETRPYDWADLEDWL